MANYQFIDKFLVFIKKNDTIIKATGLDKAAQLPTNFTNKLKIGQSNLFSLKTKEREELYTVLKQLRDDLNVLLK